MTAVTTRSPLARLLALLSDLRLAVALLGLIALASAIGTALPQGDPAEAYHDHYDVAPWLGLIRAGPILTLQLDHVYSSIWFLTLLGLLGLSLLLCSIRRQWPSLRAALRWVDYTQPRQLSKLVATASCSRRDPEKDLGTLAAGLSRRGWQVKLQPRRLAARRGVAGRVGPLLVHAGMILLMLGAVWGALAGSRLERYLAPGRSLELLDRRGHAHLSLTLDHFSVARDPLGRPEQFQSDLTLVSPTPGSPEHSSISVNHPLRSRGITLYQADWAIAALTLRFGRSPALQIPVQPLPQLGEQVWGVVLPTRPDGTVPVLLTVESEQGPVTVFDAAGQRIGQLSPGGAPLELQGLPLRITEILPASGILLKRDPGVPLVYLGFAVLLLGGGLSMISTQQLWTIASEGRLYLGGFSNRNVVAFQDQLPLLLTEILEPADQCRTIAAG